jgi:hypothetical protein
LAGERLAARTLPASAFHPLRKRELGAAERNTTQYKKNTALDKKRATNAQRRNESNKTLPTHPNTHPKKADIEDARTAIWLK